jgi:hypothetical protein
MITFNEIIDSLKMSEHEEHKCPYCWAATTYKNEDYFCEKCDVKVGNEYELI